jgi:multidrug efflux pump subunit AcrA (membrane-fusion protein)
VAVALGGAGVWVFGSWPRRVLFPGGARAKVAETVRTRGDGTVAEVLSTRGMVATRGQLLARLAAPDDEPALRRAEWSLREAEMSEEQSWRDDAARLESAARDAEKDRRRVELQALRARIRLLDVRASVSGTIVDWDAELVPGVAVASGVAMGWIADGPVSVVSCYPDMAVAGRLDEGAPVRFYPDSGGEAVTGRVARIEPSRPELLEDAELAGILGAVRSGDSLILPRPYAKVLVELDGALPRNGQTGRMWAWTRPESLAEAAGRWLKALAVRESAF